MLSIVSTAVPRFHPEQPKGIGRPVPWRQYWKMAMDSSTSLSASLSGPWHPVAAWATSGSAQARLQVGKVGDVHISVTVVVRSDENRLVGCGPGSEGFEMLKGKAA